MGILGSLVGGVEGAVKGVVGSVVGGAESAISGGLGAVKDLLTGHPMEAMGDAMKAGEGAFNVVKGITPEGAALNAVMGGGEGAVQGLMS